MMTPAINAKKNTEIDIKKEGHIFDHSNVTIKVSETFLINGIIINITHYIELQIVDHFM